MRSALYPILFRRSLLSRVFEALSHYSTKALYDPSDLTSLYQSRTGGSTGAVDSVVGIMLDKSEMGGKTAAAFIAGQSNIWSNAAATVTGESEIVSTGVFRIYSTGANSYVQNTSRLTVGAWYEVRLTIDSVTTVGSGIRVNDVGAAFTTVGSHTSILKADITTAFIKRNGAACDIQISNVQFREIPGYHALAPSDAARPILRSASSKNYLDANGTDDWMQIFPTLNLGEQWWCCLGMKQDATSAHYPFALSNAASGKGALQIANNTYRWRNAADTTTTALNSTLPTSAHVLTIEDDANIAARYNGVSEAAAFAPFDDSAATQGLTLFSAFNNSYSNGIDGRFYGGAFGTGTLTSTDRALLERYVAGLTGVTL